LELTQEDWMVRNVRLDDANAICGIYNHYIRGTSITFEEESITPDEMRRRIQKVTQSYPWFVCEEDGCLLGYGYVNKWKERSAYRHTVEATVYLHPSAVGQGKGSELLGALVADLRSREIHSVISGVALPNPASVAILDKFGFRKVAHFHEVGNKFGNWIDVGYWQLQL
jgi:L-amino acid N-acyltransferase YncA